VERILGNDKKYHARRGFERIVKVTLSPLLFNAVMHIFLGSQRSVGELSSPARLEFNDK
tara:strand:- start:440 stop:616 length:177 start_codon:yes stop_codon:yes gene_type:complete